LGRKSLEKIRKPITVKVEKWLAELLVELQDKNLEKITIDDLANLAGKSKSTIYQYFETKEDILVAACQTRIASLSLVVREATQMQDTPSVIYEYLVGTFTEGISDLSISFLHQIKTFYPIAWGLVNNFTDSFVSVLKELYRQGIQEKKYHPVSIELLASLDKYFVTQIVTNPALFPDKNYTLSHLVKDYLNLRLNGLIRKQS